MIRPFDWRDLGLLRRVHDQGLCLDSQLAFTRGSHMLQTILLDIITPGLSACTYVARPDEKEDQDAIGQIMHRAGESLARLGFIGPVDAISNPNGGRLLDALSHAAGERGAQHLIAEVDEQSPVFERIRKAGFAIYTRQRIWRLEGKPDLDDLPKSTAWRTETESDESSINHLYLNIVPALVQQVELPPKVDRGDFVYWQEGELLGYLDIERGSLGVWVDPYFHPAVENLDELLVGFLASYNDNQKRPLYFAVRSYQGWIGHALERIGFEPCSDQALMVKRLAVAVRKPALATIHAVEGTHPEPTTPFAHMCQSQIKHPNPSNHE
jgi:hypothetical protein